MQEQVFPHLNKNSFDRKTRGFIYGDNPCIQNPCIQNLMTKGGNLLCHTEVCGKGMKADSLIQAKIVLDLTD